MNKTHEKRTMASNIFRLLMRTLCIVIALIFIIQLIQGMVFGEEITKFIRKNLIDSGSILMNEYEEVQDEALENRVKRKADQVDNVINNANIDLEGIRVIAEQVLAMKVPHNKELRIHPPRDVDHKDLASSYYQLGEDVDFHSYDIQRDLALLSTMSILTEGFDGFQDELVDTCIYTKHDVILHTNAYEQEVARHPELQKKYIPIELEKYRATLEVDRGWMDDDYTIPYTKEKCVLLTIPYRDGDEIYGAVSVCIRKAFFEDTLAEGLKSGKDIGCLFYQDNGAVVFSTDTDGVFQEAEIDDENVKDSYLWKHDPEAAEKIEEEFQNEEAGMFPLTMKEPIAGSKKVTVYYSPVGDTGWYMAVIRPDSVSKKVVQSFREKLRSMRKDGNVLAFRYIINRVISILFFLIIGGWVSYVLSKRYSQRLAEPIVTLSGKVEQLDGENLDFTWDGEPDDEETQVLVDAFNRMTDRVSSDIQRIREYTAQQERMGAELSVAAQIQHAMLPGESPDFEDWKPFSVHAIMEPAREVGGDLYDYFMIDEDHLALVVGDVSGKGVPAALFMAITKALLKSELTQHGDSPEEALANVNNLLYEGNSLTMFVTVWVGVLELSTGVLVSANAGHDFPKVRSGDGGFLEVKEESFVVLGVLEDARFPRNELVLKDQDTLFVHTDGVSEAMDQAGNLFGEDRLMRVLNEVPEASPEEIETHMQEAIREFVGEAEQFDDITMLCLKIEQLNK